MLIALICGLCGAAAATSSAATVPPDWLGMNAQNVWATPTSGWLPAAQRMAASGVGTVRADAPWNLTEPQAPVDGRHNYNFTFDDALQTAIATAGMQWLPTIDYSAGWDTSIDGDQMSLPSDPSEYADYAAALASRYGPGGTFWNEHPTLPYHPVTAWEIWNEENQPELLAIAPNPAQYAILYLDARAAIKQVDPTAQVIVGGLAPLSRPNDPVSYMRAMIAAEPSLVPLADAWGLHPYASTPSAVLQIVQRFRDALVSIGAGAAPVEITEVGWPTAGLASISDAMRAGYFTQIITAIGGSNCDVTRLIPFTWTDTPGDGGFGLTTTAGTLDDSGTAVANAFRSLRNDSVPGSEALTCAGGDGSTPVRAPGRKHRRRRHTKRRHHRSRKHGRHRRRSHLQRASAARTPLKWRSRPPGAGFISPLNHRAFDSRCISVHPAVARVWNVTNLAAVCVSSL